MHKDMIQRLEERKQIAEYTKEKFQKMKNGESFTTIDALTGKSKEAVKKEERKRKAAKKARKKNR